jgi:hypothetical protein
MEMGTLVGVCMLLCVYLAAGCSVAAGSWDSVRRRHPQFPKSTIGIATLAVSEAARWPLTLFGR